MALLLCHYLGIYNGHSPITLLITIFRTAVSSGNRTQPYLRLGLLLLKKDDNSDKAEEEIEEELKRTSEIRSLAIKESTELFLMLVECLFATGSWTNNYIV